jgi:hypothetical protein
MMKNAKRFLVLFCAIVVLAIGSAAQVRQASPENQCRETADVLNTISKAKDTAVFENGRLKSLRIRLPKTEEQLVTFEYPGDDKSFTMVTAGRRITVLLDHDRRISAVIFPDGKRAEFSWALAPNGYWVPATIKIDGRDINQSSFIDDGSCADKCQHAAAVTVIAIGTCVASGPASAACWGATAAAGLATYYCYRCSHPEIEEPPVN